MNIFYILLLLIILAIIFLSLIIKNGLKNIVNSINNIKFDYKINNYIPEQPLNNKKENIYENNIEDSIYKAQSKVFEKPALISKNNEDFIIREDDISDISIELQRMNKNG